MNDRPRHILIVGAGIAGLSLALALAKFGLKITVLEKSDRVETQGAGIQLSPNARHILDQLGLSQALNAVAFQPEAIDLIPFLRAQPINSLKLGEVAYNRFGARYDVIHRADLLDVLHRACKRFANIDILLGIRTYDVQWHAKGASLLYEDANRQSINVRPFAIIGADGVHSPMRNDMIGGEPAKYSGMVAWRTLVPMSENMDRFSRERTTLLWGPGFHTVLYPLPVKKLFNVALFTKQDKKEIQSGTIAQTPNLPKNLLRSEHFQQLLEAATHGWTYWPLFAVQTREWSKGPVGLVGDAAHAMLPFQAQGAAMAIEDAATLAPLLASAADPAVALTAYAASRKKRVSKMARLSKSNGFAFHLEWPFTLARDLVIGAQNPDTHFERLAWIYDFRVKNTVENATS